MVHGGPVKWSYQFYGALNMLLPVEEHHPYWHSRYISTATIHPISPFYFWTLIDDADYFDNIHHLNWITVDL